MIFLLVRLFLYMRKKVGDAPLSGLARRQAAGIHEAGAVPVSRARVSLMSPSPSKTVARPHVPLMGTAAAKSGGPHHIPLMDAHPAPRVRPTVTSIRRAMPRTSIQQASLPPLIEMRVEQQNHRVGFRNVHRIGTGAARSVGGRFSSFLVFLVPMPAGIAEIRNVDGRYVFTPLRAELFPGISGPIEDCLGRKFHS